MKAKHLRPSHTVASGHPQAESGMRQVNAQQSSTDTVVTHAKFLEVFVCYHAERHMQLHRATLMVGVIASRIKIDVFGAIVKEILPKLRSENAVDEITNGHRHSILIENDMGMKLLVPIIVFASQDKANAYIKEQMLA